MNTEQEAASSRPDAAYLSLDVVQLIEILEDPHALLGDRGRAARVLGCKDDTSAIPPLLAALQDRSENVRVRCMAIVGLRSLGAREVIPILRELLTDPATERDLIIFSIGTLGFFGDNESVPAFMAQLSNPDGGIRRIAVFAVGRCHAIAAVPVLTTMLSEDPTAYVRHEASVALAALQAAESAAGLTD